MDQIHKQTNNKKHVADYKIDLKGVDLEDKKVYRPSLCHQWTAVVRTYVLELNASDMFLMSFKM